MSATNKSRAYRKFKRAANRLMKRNSAVYRKSGVNMDAEAAQFVRGLGRTVAAQIRHEKH